MLRSAFCVFIFAAVFKSAVCDISCFLKKDLENSKQLSKLKTITKFNVELCRPVKNYLDLTRNATKECKTEKIDVTEAEAFTKDICTVGWELNTRFRDKESCFESHLESARECGHNVTIPEDTPEGDLKDVYDMVCKNLTDAYDCFNKRIGKPCDAEGLALTKKLTEAVSSYTKGLCLEVGGASTISTLSWTALLGILSVVLTWHKY